MEATCRAAAVFVGKVYRKSELHISRPGGCFFDTGNPNKVYLNPNATGAAFANAQPLCQVAGAPRASLCVYSCRVLTAGARGDVFSTDAVTARHSRRRWFGTCVQPHTRRTLRTPGSAWKASSRSPTRRRVKPRRRSSGGHTVEFSLLSYFRGGATSKPRLHLSTSTPTRPAALPLTRSRCAKAPVRRSNRRLLHTP
jgi:hypothetical protein